MAWHLIGIVADDYPTRPGIAADLFSQPGNRATTHVATAASAVPPEPALNEVESAKPGELHYLLPSATAAAPNRLRSS